MPNTEFREVLSVDKEKIYSVIIDYERYPSFVEGCTHAHVEKKTPDCVRVKYQVNMLSQEIVYVLDHFENPDEGSVKWSLVESNFLKKNLGRWQLKSVGENKTDVLYAIDIEFKIPVPGFILNRLVKGSLPGMVLGFGKRASTI